MAHYYGTTPSRLLSSSLGDWSIDLEVYNADMEATKIERAQAEQEAQARRVTTAAGRSRRR